MIWLAYGTRFAPRCCGRTGLKFTNSPCPNATPQNEPLPPAPRRGLAHRNPRAARSFDGQRGLDENLPPLDIRQPDIPRNMTFNLRRPGCPRASTGGFGQSALRLGQSAFSGREILRAISEVTTDLRTYCANGGITALVLSQFNRATTSEFRVRPRVSGLWGGAVIEQSSDLVILLGHHAYERDEARAEARSWLLVEKNRHGPCGDIPIHYSYKTLIQRQGLANELSAWPNP